MFFSFDPTLTQQSGQRISCYFYYLTTIIILTQKIDINCVELAVTTRHATTATGKNPCGNSQLHAILPEKPGQHN